MMNERLRLRISIFGWTNLLINNFKLAFTVFILCLYILDNVTMSGSNTNKPGHFQWL